MENRTFAKILITTALICLGLTAVHLLYVIDAYQKCSIIYFIAKEIW